MGPAPPSELDRITARLDALVRAFEAHPDTQVRGNVLDLLALVDALHRPGLERLAETIVGEAPGLYERLLQDPAVRTLLVLYDLAPPGPAVEVDRALEGVRAQLAADAEGVRLLDIVGGVVHVRVDFSARGCALPAEALRSIVEAAVRPVVPGYRGVAIHGGARPGRVIPVVPRRPGGGEA